MHHISHLGKDFCLCTKILIFLLPDHKNKNASIVCVPNLPPKRQFISLMSQTSFLSQWIMPLFAWGEQKEVYGKDTLVKFQTKTYHKEDFLNWYANYFYCGKTFVRCLWWQNRRKDLWRWHAARKKYEVEHKLAIAAEDMEHPKPIEHEKLDKIYIFLSVIIWPIFGIVIYHRL